MSGNRFIVDTNIVIYFLNGDPVLRKLLDRKSIHVSFVTQIELLGYPGITEVEAPKRRGFFKPVYHH